MNHANQAQHTRASVGLAAVPTPSSEIERETERLHQELSLLDDNLGRLGERMSGVLNDLPPPAPVGAATDESDPRSPYGRRIRSLRRMVERLNSVVQGRLLEDLAA